MVGNNTFDESEFRDQATKDGITHISTGAAIIRIGKILLCRRVVNDFLGGVYELPGGGVDQGESITDGVAREVKEETGLTVSRIVTSFTGFDYTTDKKPMVRQINFIVEVEPGDVVLNPKEHDEYTWVDHSILANLNTSDNMRRCVKEAFEIIENQK